MKDDSKQLLLALALEHFAGRSPWAERAMSKLASRKI